MRILFIIALLFIPSFAAAQEVATLIADSVTLNNDDQLIAIGNVEAFYDGNRLSAREVIYDQTSDTLQIKGPIFIQAADGSILTADRATLDPQLEFGILQSARLVLDRELQLAANQIDRIDGRYTQLYKTTATSCRVCGDRAPLWEIRAEKVIQDAQERQLYFQNATLRVRGIPVFWLPRIRLPEPGVERATGFLIPQQRTTSQLGWGIKLPYFITFGTSRDLTVTPYISPQTRTLELIYRQAFVNGDLRVEAAISDDTLIDEPRAYLFADAAFDLANDYQLAFDIEATSDPAYLLNYGYSDKDRLDSAISLLRVQETTLFNTRLTFYDTLRETETRASLSRLIGDLSYERRIVPDFGGVLRYRASADTAYRTSNQNGDRGRDTTRGGIETTWSNSWISKQGIEIGFQTGTALDVYVVNDDSDFAQEDLRAVPSANVTLRWPWGMTQNNGTAHVIEPVIGLAWSDTYGGTPPNEDSTRTELDRGNLLATSRLAGEDRAETGTRLATGLSWTRLGAGGGQSILSFGRVYRTDAESAFTASSGLDDTRSDWLVAGQIIAPGGFLIGARSLWDEDKGLNTADGRLIWRNDDISLEANYNWQIADSAENRPDTVSEISFDSGFQINNQWTLEFDGRYDVAADRAVSTKIGVEWRNECVTIDVSASRRFTSSSTVEPTTEFGISGEIGGFSTGRAAGGIATGCGN